MADFGKWFGRKPPDPAAAAAAAGLTTHTSADSPTAAPRKKHWWLRWLLGTTVAIALVFWAIGWYWSREPKPFWVNEKTPDGRVIVGYSTVDTLEHVINWMLEKPGGYLSNDVAPPGIWLDNMPSFEF